MLPLVDRGGGVNGHLPTEVIVFQCSAYGLLYYDTKANGEISFAHIFGYQNNYGEIGFTAVAHTNKVHSCRKFNLLDFMFLKGDANFITLLGVIEI